MKAAKTRALHPKAKPAAKAAKAKHAAKSAKAKKTAKKPAPHHHPAPHHPLTAHQLHLQHLKHLRGWSPGDVACCTAEALAASLRLCGVAVSDSAVLDLFWLAGGDESAGASILAVLGAAYEFGLGGVRPVRFGPVDLDDPAAVILGLGLPEGPHAVAVDPSGGVWSWGGLYDLGADAVLEEAWAVTWEAGELASGR